MEGRASLTEFPDHPSVFLTREGTGTRGQAICLWLS